ncbi:hypothetical protein ABH915_001892 [Arthrobacter sp. MW3 TE3886]
MPDALEVMPRVSQDFRLPPRMAMRTCSQVMQLQALPAMKEYTATPLSKPREGAARPATTNKNGPPQGPTKRRFVHIQRPTSP